MPKQIKTTKKVHEFVKQWIYVQNKLGIIKEEICNRCNWSVSTFHNKINLGLKNQLELTEFEANELAEIFKTKIL
jgi:hypothetical protein